MKTETLHVRKHIDSSDTTGRTFVTACITYDPGIPGARQESIHKLLASLVKGFDPEAARPIQGTGMGVVMKSDPESKAGEYIGYTYEPASD